MKYLKTSNKGKQADIRFGDKRYVSSILNITKNKAVKHVVFAVRRQYSESNLGPTGYLHLFFHDNGKVNGCFSHGKSCTQTVATQLSGTWLGNLNRQRLKVQSSSKKKLTIRMV